MADYHYHNRNGGDHTTTTTTHSGSNNNNNNNENNNNNNTTTGISSVDYFLLDNLPPDNHTIAAAAAGQVAHPNSDSMMHPPPGTTTGSNHESSTTSVTGTPAVVVGDVTGELSQQHPQQREGSVDYSNNNNNHDVIVVGSNRCRLGSSNTNTSISTCMNTTTTADRHATSTGIDGCRSSSGAVEQIYFDGDVMTVPSTTMLERGESSYSLLVSSSSPNTITSPFLVVDHNNNNNNNNTSTSRSGSINHHRRVHGSRRRTSSNQEFHRQTPELSGLNILNALTYTVHIIIWWTCGVWGLDHVIDSHWQQTQRHETLLTPTTWAAHYLWVPIMIFEAVFTVAQLLPHYRARPIITSGTSYFFFYTVLLQIAYTLLFSFGLFVFSFICIVLALVSLLSLLASQQYHGSADMNTTTLTTSLTAPFLPTSNRGLMRTLSGGNIGNGRWLSSHRMIEYVLFSFPFYLHAGWLILMAVDHFSLLFRRYNSAIDAQLASDIVGLAILLVAAIYALNQPTAMGPDFVIPTVILWSYIGIACRLCFPSDTMIDAYGLVAIGSIRIATFCFLGIVICCMIPHIVICLAREFCTINVVELE